MILAAIFLLPFIHGADYRGEIPRFLAYAPPTQEVYLHGKARLNCQASSTSLLDVQWYRNGATVKNSARVKIDKRNMALEIRTIEVSDQGTWACKVSNNGGHIVRNFTIEILDFCNYFQLPITPTPMECVCLWKDLSSRPDHINYNEATAEACQKYGDRVAMHRKHMNVYETVHDQKPYRHPVKLFDWIVQNEGVDISHLLPNLVPYDEMWRMQWLLRGWENLSPKEKITRARYMVKMRRDRVIEANDDEDDEDEDDEVRAKSDELSISRLPKQEQSSSIISSFSVPPSQVQTVELEKKVDTPTSKPYFTETSKNIAVPAGRSIRLRCDANGDPKKSPVWLKNNETIVPSTPRVTGGYVFRKWSLEIEDATVSDSGEYRCEVFNELGTAEKTFYVTVRNRMRAPPLIVPNILTNQTVNVNGTAYFKCQVVSDLMPYIMWVKLNKGPDGSYHYKDPMNKLRINYTDMADVEGAYIRVAEDTSTLVLEHVSVEDQGVYACITGSQLGTNMANATLHVNDFMGMEIPTGELEPEMSAWSIVGLVAAIAIIAFLIFLCATYFAWLTFWRSKHQLDEEAALLGKRKKIIVTHRTYTDEGGSDPQSSYMIKVVEQRTPSKGRRVRASSAQIDDYEIESDPDWEIDRTRLKLEETIGSGAFGEVCRALLYPETPKEGAEPMPVAVKKVRTYATEKDLISLVGEMEMFKSIGEHRNVLRLIGCCTGPVPLYVILELCEHGNLRDFLKAHRPHDSNRKPTAPDYLEPRRPDTNRILIRNLTHRHLVEFAEQVAEGMQFMASKKIVHRDLAARNVLVAAGFVMKISDFGLSRDVHYGDYYRKRGGDRMPYKWMAIESLDENQISTVESDVWSFGILLWEIMTMGGTPYPTIAMQELYGHLKKGYRMECPHNCPEEIYRLMKACWQEKREARPDFTYIVDYLQWMLHEPPELEAEENESNGPNSDGRESSRKPSASEDDEGNQRRRTARPLSAPVTLPLETTVNNHLEQDGDLPRERAPMLSTASKAHAFNSVPEYAVPHHLVRQQTDPTLDGGYSEPRIIPSMTAPSIDSAIESPAWHLTDPNYAAPFLGDQGTGKTEPSYVNVYGVTRFPFPPLNKTSTRYSDYDSFSSLHMGNTNNGYMPSPALEHNVDTSQRFSEESCSSGQISNAISGYVLEKNEFSEAKPCLSQKSSLSGHCYKPNVSITSPSHSLPTYVSCQQNC